MSRAFRRALVIDGVIVLAWLTSVGMVVVHERGQLWGGLGNPSATLGAHPNASTQWFGIYYQGHKIGFSQTMLVPEEHEGVPGVAVIDMGRLSFNLLGVPQRLEVRARAFIDADWRLQVFSASLRSSTQQLEWTGRRRGDGLEVTVTMPTGSVTKYLNDPTGSAFVNGLSSWAAFHRLRVGQSGKAWILNPLALSPEVVYFIVRRTETVEGTLTLVVETDVAGMTTTSWVTPDGRVVKETSPMGWELRSESQSQALREVHEDAPALDLLSTTSVPVDRSIASPEHVTMLTVLVEGSDGSRLATRPGQRVLSPDVLSRYHRPPPDGPWCVLQLQRLSAPVSSASLQAMSPNLRRYQRASLFVQSDDERIVKKAAEIVGAQTDPWAQAMALHQWVYRTLTKQLTLGLSSAVDILATPVGDCQEHTIVFTALARSLGIPTRMMAGLVYQQGRFYYHAWPEVWIGQWVPSDPTLGQLIADATHIGLSEAENEQLVILAQFVGKLRVQVLDVQQAASPQ